MVLLGAVCVAPCVLAGHSKISTYLATHFTPPCPSLQVNAVMYLALTGIIQLQLFATRNPSLWFWFSKKTAPPPALLLVVPAVRVGM